MLNSMINSLPTPDLLRMWKIRGDAKCYLCNRSPCTLHHILVNCYPALHGKRYNWRHDSVLSTLHPVLTKQLTSYNSSKTTNFPKHIPIHFIKSGNTSTKGIRYQRPSLFVRRCWLETFGRLWPNTYPFPTRDRPHKRTSRYYHMVKHCETRYTFWTDCGCRRRYPSGSHS